MSAPGERERMPYKIGAIVDLPPKQEWLDAVRLAFDEAHERRLIERPVELVVREVYAQPWTDGFPCVEAFNDLVTNERVLGVLGPMTTDNALAVLPEVERTGVPTCTMSGTLLYYGKAAFNLPNGGMGDEPSVIAAWLKGQGHGRVALLRETTQIGEEYTAYFRRAAHEAGLAIVAESPAYPFMEVDEVARALEPLKASKPDALVYLGLGRLYRQFKPAFEMLGWDPPRITTTAFVRALVSREDAEAWEGWVGVDQYDERNEVFRAVLDRFEKRYGYRPQNTRSSCGYDMGHAYGIALGRMRVAMPSGLRDALETIRRLPACTGGPGTVIGFGPEDHRGYKGPDYLILRRARGGTTEFEGTAPVAPWEQ
jgi:ABC-type branched-subunit amino acid transport system substrate-binding protein